MVQLERKALYNALRMNWERDRGTSVKEWQVRNYRDLSMEQLFEMLEELDLPMTEESLLLHAEDVDNPEELADLLSEEGESPEVDDRRYLILFELWRRLLPDQQSLSIFCDELDCAIALYDEERLDRLERMQDLLANLQEVLDENADEGCDPQEVMESLSCYSANDIESFLYDFIAEQLEGGSHDYAAELIEGFYPYMSDPRWFDLLNARVSLLVDPETVDALLEQVVRAVKEAPDLDLSLELLEVLSRCGSHDLFVGGVRETMALLEQEGDFLDLLEICQNYCVTADLSDQEGALAEMIAARQGRDEESPWKRSDWDAQRLSQILDQLERV